MRKFIIKPDLPFSVTRFPFFYGWVIVAAGSLGILMSVPGQTIGFAAFTESIKDTYFSFTGKHDILWISIAYMIGTGTSAFLAPWAGRLFDRYGARIMAMSTAFLLGLSLVLIARGHCLLSFLGIDTFLPASLFFLSFCFFLIRLLGQGSLTMTSRNMVMKWFDKNRGLANALIGVVLALGFNSSPRFFSWLNDLYGWENTYYLLAVTIGVVFVIIVFITFRDNPEIYGLKPDGEKPLFQSKKNTLKNPHTSPVDYTLKETLKTNAFWSLNLVLTMQSLYLTAVTFWIEGIFAEAQLSKEVAISIFIPSAIGSTLVQFAASWISDYIRLKYLIILEVLGIMTGLAGMILLNTFHQASILIIIGNSLSAGLFGVLAAVAWPRYFGIRHLGAISGYNMGWMVGGSAIGPAMFALIKYLSGSYHVAGYILLVGCVGLLVLSLRSR